MVDLSTVDSIAEEAVETFQDIKGRYMNEGDALSDAVADAVGGATANDEWLSESAWEKLAGEVYDAIDRLHPNLLSEGAM